MGFGRVEEITTISNLRKSICFLAFGYIVLDKNVSSLAWRLQCTIYDKDRCRSTRIKLQCFINFAHNDSTLTFPPVLYE